MNTKYKILVVNPGATSTKIAVYSEENPLLEKNIPHPVSALLAFELAIEQYDYRLSLVRESLREAHVDPNSLDAIVGRGGLLKPLASGAYLINAKMVEDLIERPVADHASNLGAVIAYNLAKELKIPAYIVDPVVVDEFEDIARFSGHPSIERTSRLHALNMKAVGRRVASRLGKTYKDMTFIIVHLGSGFSITVHHRGRMIDSTNAMDDGPFSVERSGDLPVTQLVKFCYQHFAEGKSVGHVQKLLTSESGVFGYLKTKDLKEVERRAHDGESLAKTVLNALSYQVAKAVGAMATVVHGRVDKIVITGGAAHSEHITSAIRERIGYISHVIIEPGEEELLAMAEGALRILRGEEPPKDYS
ncbi:butyrate kinase [Acidobacteriota bacterium]